MIDREARFRERLAAVEAADERRRRRDRWSRGVLAILGAVAVVTVGALLDGTLGALVGVAAVGLAVGAAALARRLAVRRGAAAWDWQAGRHRLLGNPSQQVRSRDEPDPHGRGPLG